MKISFDIDVVLLFVIPIIFVINLLFITNEILVFSSVLIIAIFIFECIIFDSRHYLGFSGLRTLSIPSLIIFSYTMFIAIPSVYVSSLKSHDSVYSYFFSVISFYLLFPMGLKLAELIWPINILKFNRLKNSNLSISNIDFIVFEVLIAILLISIGIFGLYLMRTNTIPLIELIKNPGDYARLSLLREESLKLLPITFIERYLIMWQRSIFMPLGILASLALATLKHNTKYWLLFWIYFFTGMFFNSITLEKSPSAAIVMGLISFLILKQNRLKMRLVLPSIITVFTTPIAIMASLHFQKENLFKVIYISLFERIFIIPAEALFYYFKIFPNIHDHLLGRSTQFFSWLHSDGTFPINNYVAKIWWKSPDTSGFANAIFLGNFWADFGFVGIIISCFLVGFVSYWFYWKILTTANYQKNIIYIVFSSMVVPIFTFSFISANFTQLFFTQGLIIIVIFLFILNRLPFKIESLN